MRLDEDYITIYRGYMYAIVMAFLPFALLSILTIGILYSMKQKNQKKSIKPKKLLAIESKPMNNNNTINNYRFNITNGVIKGI
uniref:NADH dehydrogenase subunit 6 n=1 Tax=Acrobeloides nanus TaxID=290746 RepID=A0A914CUW5_9BILA